MTRLSKQLRIVTPKDRRAWRQWLKKNHTTSASIWLVVQKKKSKTTGVSLSDAVEEALCFGWIDGTLNVLDDERYKLLFSPRKPKSTWSKGNKQRVEKLIRQGLMTDAGFETIEIAKKNGSWSMLDAVEKLVIPPDLQKALDENPTAARNFSRFPASKKKSILYWIQCAKRPETRSKRIQQTVIWAMKNIKP